MAITDASKPTDPAATPAAANAESPAATETALPQAPGALDLTVHTGDDTIKAPNTDRLKEEDQQTAHGPQESTGNQSIFQQMQKENTTTAPSNSLEEDMHIIQALQDGEASPIATTPTVQENIPTIPALQGDDSPSIFGTTTETKQAETSTQLFSLNQEANITPSESPSLAETQIPTIQDIANPQSPPEQASALPVNTPASDIPSPLQQSLTQEQAIPNNVVEQEINTTTATENVVEMPNTMNQAPTIDATSPQPIQQTPSTTINLDNLVQEESTATPTTIPTPFDVNTSNAPTAIPIPNTPPVQINEVANTSAVLDTTAQVHNKHKGVKVGLFIVLFVALGFLTYFIISTMYPMGLFAGKSTGEVILPPEEIVAELTGEVLTGEEILTGEDENALVYDTDQDTGTTHGSATDDDNFLDMNELIDDDTQASTQTGLDQNSLISSLQRYQGLGSVYLDISKENKDLTSMKYALYLKNKSQTLMDEIIANPTAISTMQETITTELEQYEIFLQKLISKYGEMSGEQNQNIGPESV